MTLTELDAFLAFAQAQRLGGAGVTLATGYAYDAATGRLTTVTLPSGKVLNLAYGSDGRVSGLGYDGQPVVANVQWTAFDAIAGWSWPQAVGWSGIHSSVAFTYDLDGRPTAIEDLDERSLVWDNGDRLVGVDDANDVAKSQVYGYDTLDRLTSADPWGSTWWIQAPATITGLRRSTSTSTAGAPWSSFGPMW